MSWTNVISDLSGKEIVETFYKKELQKKKKKKNSKRGWKLKINKEKGDKLYVKWKKYNNSLKNWIDKKKHSINKCIFSRSKILRKRVKVGLHLSNYAIKQI